MNDILVIDLVVTPVWDTLDQLVDDFDPDLCKLFADDPDYTQTFTFDAANLHVGLPKDLVCSTLVGHLLTLTRQTGVLEPHGRICAGEHINVIEDRAILHTALRRPVTDSLTVGDQDVTADVHEALEKVYTSARRVRSGEWVGITGKPVKIVISVGIGGSNLDPTMVYGALKPHTQRGLECCFISNIDPIDAGETIKDLDPEMTLVIIASRTFIMLETIMNAKVMCAWLFDGLRGRGIVTDETSEKEAIAKRFIAVSTAPDSVVGFGADPANTFSFWSWVGSRYSVDSAVDASLAVATGPESFTDLLASFHTMDRHLAEITSEENVPLLMGLPNVWYSNFLGADTHAVLPYSQYLHCFPAHLQQLTIESNGKPMRHDGSPVTYEAGGVFWGGPNTNGWHTFCQLTHQGARMVPADFIALVNLTWALGDGDANVYELFLLNFLAQIKALTSGKTSEGMRAEGTLETIVPACVFTGNRPTTSITAPSLIPSVLGQLIALYGHIAFAEDAV